MYHDTDIHIGRKIKERRIAIGMSLATLSEKLGITFQQVQKYESGANRVGGSRLWDIAAALSVPIAYFFEGLGAPQAQPNSACATDTDRHLPLSRQSLELARAINTIPEGEVREQIIRLVKAFSKVC